MGAGASTGTICPFPFTTTNTSEIPTDISQCTVTYADAIGPAYSVVRGIVIAVASLAILVVAYRIWQFTKYAERMRVIVWHQPMFVMMIIGLMFDIVLLVETVDMFAFAGLYPIQVYVILDEVFASLVLTDLVLVVNLYHNLATVFKDPRKQFVNIVRTATICAIWINFVGFIVLGVLDSARYRLYDGLKCLGGASILCIFGIMTTYYASQLLKILHSGLGFTTQGSKIDSQIAQIKSKHIRLLAVLVFAIVALMANGIVGVTLDDYSWVLKISDLPDPAQIAFRMVFVGVVAMELYLLRVPMSESGRGIALSDSKSQDKVLGIVASPTRENGGSTLGLAVNSTVVNSTKQVAPVQDFSSS